MDSSQKFFNTFDKFLFSGLGCGIIGLCLLATAFVYTFRNPPRPRPTDTPLGFVAPSTATSDPVTSTLSFTTPSPFPTLTVTPQGTLPILPTAGANFGNNPPSGKIVFTCYINQIDQICLMNADGSGRQQLTSAGATSFYASLSPDEGTIYFVSKQAGTFDIYSMSIKGKGLKRLTKNIGNLYAPEISSSGDRIVFTNESDNKQRIWVMRPDGKNPHAITDGPEDIDPTWSPDGSRIAFASARSGQRQLYIMDKDGSEIIQVTNLDNMGGRNAWSPDGTKLAFYRGPTGDHNIYVINVDGTGLIQLTNGGDNLGPSWSPDGNWIAFTSYRDGNNEIYIMHPDGTGVTRLTTNPTSDWQPRWGN
jgi:Tol biopolymer transport system component